MATVLTNQREPERVAVNASHGRAGIGGRGGSRCSWGWGRLIFRSHMIVCRVSRAIDKKCGCNVLAHDALFSFIHHFPAHALSIRSISASVCTPHLRLREMRQSLRGHTAEGPGQAHNAAAAASARAAVGAPGVLRAMQGIQAGSTCSRPCSAS